MLGSRLRNGKQRLFLLLPAGIALLLGIFIIRDIHLKLQDARNNSDKCQQHEESLAAQLQVVYEHKSRLEKSLQLEKTQHKKTKDELQFQLETLQEKKEREKQDTTNRFNSLQQQHKMLQIQTDDLQDELNKVQQSNQELVKEKQQMQSSLDEQVQFGKQNEKDIFDLKDQIKKLRNEIVGINQQLLEKDQQILLLDNQVKDCATKLSTEANKQLGMATNPPSIVLSPPEKKMAEELKDKLKKNSDAANEDAADKKSTEKPVVKPVIAAVDGESNFKEGIKNVAEKLKQNSFDFEHLGHGPLKERSHNSENIQLGNQQPVLPLLENARNLNHKLEEDDRDGVIQVPQLPAGLEQQENGDDQDPDNIEDDEQRGVLAQKQAKEGKQFEDTDFDQVEDIGNRIKHQEGVVIAPN